MYPHFLALKKYLYNEFKLFQQILLHQVFGVHNVKNLG